MDDINMIYNIFPKLISFNNKKKLCRTSISKSVKSLSNKP